MLWTPDRSKHQRQNRIKLMYLPEGMISPGCVSVNNAIVQDLKNKQVVPND